MQRREPEMADGSALRQILRSRSALPICWPRHFPIRLLSVVLLGALVGALLAALLTRAPARDVQATVRLRVYYTDLPQGELAGAVVYLDAAAAGDVDPRNKFSFPVGGTAKRLVPGERDFWIQPLDRRRQPDGPAFHERRQWPRRDGGIIEFEVRRAYARPR